MLGQCKGSVTCKSQCITEVEAAPCHYVQLCEAQLDCKPDEREALEGKYDAVRD